MAGAFALVGGTLIAKARPARPEPRTTAESRRAAALGIATTAATAIIAVAWVSLVWAFGVCSEAAEGSSAERYCDFVVDDFSTRSARFVAIIVLAATAPFITLIGGVIAVRTARGLPLALGGGIGLAIIVAAGLPFRVA